MACWRETMGGAKYRRTKPHGEAVAEEHTPSPGLLSLEHAGDLQTAWSLHSCLFCIGCFKKAKDFFFVCYMYARNNSSWRMKISQGSVCNLRGAFGSSCKAAIFSQVRSFQGGDRCGPADGWCQKVSVFSESQLGPQWELHCSINLLLARRALGSRVAGV